MIIGIKINIKIIITAYIIFHKINQLLFGVITGILLKITSVQFFTYSK